MNRNEDEGIGKKAGGKHQEKQMLTEIVQKARRMIIKGDVDQASREITDLLALPEIVQTFHDSAIELLPAYITLAEAQVCKGGSKLKRGEKLLIVAYWNLLKQTSEENKSAAEQSLVTPRELESYRASLHKAFGRLFTAQTRYADAIKELAQGIYLECNEFGPESIQVCSSYFYLGSIMQKQDKKEEASAFYQKIIEIWKKAIQGSLENQQALEDEGEDIKVVVSYYDEAKEYFKHILLFFEMELGPQDGLTAECNTSYALIMFRTGNLMVAIEFIDKAYYAFMARLGEFDPKTKEVGELMAKINEVQ